MNNLLAEEGQAFFVALQDPPLSALRLNNLKVSNFPTAWENWKLRPISWCPTGYILEEDLSLGKHPYHAAGLYYLQEPSAMSVSEILAPRPGERVLDLCAAPGGKSTHLAALMGNQGLLISNEIHPQRAWELAENLERWGATNTIILNETPERLAEHFGAFFDRVLLDAPCSGEGMFRKSAAARRDWSPALVQGCAARQAEILRQAARLVRPGGYLAYSTCTFNPQENEEVISHFLEGSPENGKWALINSPWYPGFDPGRPEWAHGGREELLNAVRIWPQRAAGEGHFIALLHETNSQFLPDFVRQKLTKIEPGAYKLFVEFCQTALNISFEPERLALVGSYLYRLPEGAPELGGLKVIHPGWWLGTLKKGRCEPSHALALGLQADDAQHKLDFQPGDPLLIAYLRGEALRLDGEEGWVLISVDGHPLGWGKCSQGIIKNYYPKGLRFY